jgi:hypothetical protein
LIVCIAKYSQNQWKSGGCVFAPKGKKKHGTGNRFGLQRNFVKNLKIWGSAKKCLPWHFLARSFCRAKTPRIFMLPALRGGEE